MTQISFIKWKVSFAAEKVCNSFIKLGVIFVAGKVCNICRDGSPYICLI